MFQTFRPLCYFDRITSDKNVNKNNINRENTIFKNFDREINGTERDIDEGGDVTHLKTINEVIVAPSNQDALINSGP